MKVIDMGYLIYHYAGRLPLWDTDKYLFSKHTGTVLATESPFSYRKEFDSQYKKKTRGTALSEYHQRAYKLWREVTRDSLFNVVSYYGLEGDDVCTLLHASQGYSIISGDKDFLQLPYDVHTLKGEVLRDNAARLFPKSFQGKVEPTPLNCLLSLVLFGDKADNVARLIPLGKEAIRESLDVFLAENPIDTAIEYYGEESVARNLYLTLLPYPGYLKVSVDNVLSYTKELYG